MKQSMQEALDSAKRQEENGEELKKYLRGLSGELNEFYKWVREKNSHTPDEVVDYMWKAVKMKLQRDMEYAKSVSLTADERAELVELDNYINGCDGGDRPMSPAVPKYRRYLELKKKMDE